MTPETIIYFGKYVGKTVAQIQTLDKSYHKWLVDSWKLKGLDSLNKKRTPTVKVYEEKEVFKETKSKYLCYICGCFKCKFRMEDKIRICYSCCDKNNANQIGRLVTHIFKKQNRILQ